VLSPERSTTRAGVIWSHVFAAGCGPSGRRVTSTATCSAPLFRSLSVLEPGAASASRAGETESATGMTPIKLAGPTETALWTPGYPTQVSGYGFTAEGGPRSNTLRVATVPIIADSTCGSPGVYGGLFYASSMVCAGSLSGGVDSCSGDSGGPLESPAQGGIYRLVGLVSWGIGCAEPNNPGVYARLGGGSGTLHQLVVNDVSSVETAQGLPHNNIDGSGPLPLGAPVPTTPRKRCKKRKRLNEKTGKCVCKKKFRLNKKTHKCVKKKKYR
jgi:hypothetical protein